MRCPRCDTEIPDGQPCPGCGARVTHLRFGSDPDYSNVRRTRLDTPAHLVRYSEGGLPRLRRSAAAAAGRSRAYAVGGVVALLLILALGLLLAGNDTGVARPGAGAVADAEPADAGPDVTVLAPPPLFLPAPGVAWSAPGVVPQPAAPVAPWVPGPAPDAAAAVPPAPVQVMVPVPQPVVVPLPIPAPQPGVAAPPGAVVPAAGGPAPPVLAAPPAVLEIAAVPPAPVPSPCVPAACAPDAVGWAVADRARDLADTDPALAACWAIETVRQGRRFEVPGLVASGYFHLGLAFQRMGCREKAHGAYLSALCEGRAAIRPALLEGYRAACERTGDGCDAPCRAQRLEVPAAAGP